MRTGSPRNAFFKGDNEAEYAWFSVSDALPVISISAQCAARQIVRVCLGGDAEVVLSLPAQLAVKFNGVFPSLTADLMGMVNQLLPSADGPTRAKTGAKSYFESLPLMDDDFERAGGPAEE